MCNFHFQPNHYLMMNNSDSGGPAKNAAILSNDPDALIFLAY